MQTETKITLRKTMYIVVAVMGAIGTILQILGYNDAAETIATIVTGAATLMGGTALAYVEKSPDAQLLRELSNDV